MRSGKVYISFAYADLLRPIRVAILAYGLPDSPSDIREEFVKRLIRRGFVVAIPEYIGTFDSGGKCNFENSADTILETIKLFKKGRAKELFTMKELRWRAKEIILIGGSFGASVVLVAGAKSRHVKKIVSLAAHTNYRYTDPNSNEESIYDLYHMTKRTFPLTWRFASKKAWTDLGKGRLDLNAVDYVKSLKGKDVLLIHGMKDKVLNFSRSAQLYGQIKGGKGRKRLILLKNEGHFGLGILRKPRIFNQVVRFLR